MKPLALILAAVFVVIAILYWTGHGPFATPVSHPKHGVVAVILALLCLVWYRFQSAEQTR